MVRTEAPKYAGMNAAVHQALASILTSLLSWIDIDILAAVDPERPQL